MTAAKVEFRMLSDDRDRERPRDGYQRAVALVRHPAVAGLADAVLAGQTPLAELEAPGALDRWMDDNVTNYVHAVSSCRMGAADDPATGRPRILTAAGGRRGHRRVAGARCRPARHRDSPSPVATLSD